MTLVSGALLLFSTATPAVTTSLKWLRELLPISMVETSHYVQRSRTYVGRFANLGSCDYASTFRIAEEGHSVLTHGASRHKLVFN
jgi:hypothetical protein